MRGLHFDDFIFCKRANAQVQHAGAHAHAKRVVIEGEEGKTGAGPQANGCLAHLYLRAAVAFRANEIPRRQGTIQDGGRPDRVAHGLQ